jgi:hypothetical protein
MQHLCRTALGLGFGVGFRNAFDGGQLSLAKGDTFPEGNYFI